MGISSFPVPKSGIPSGNTAGRPANPVIGDTYYDGTLGIIVIFDGTNFIPCSAPAARPTIAVADVGTGVAYGAAQGLVTFTPGTSGGKAEGFTVSSSTGGYSASTSGTTTTVTVGDNGSWTFSAVGFNSFGISVASPTVTQTLTTVPQAPTIGTATASTSATEVTVTWTLGNNGGKNLSAITITPYLNGTTAQTAATAATTSSTSHTFTTLTGGSSYTFKVSATNANGIGLESAASASATPPKIITVDYLVIAGGAGGGTGRGAGGGAGGYRTSSGTSGANTSAESALSIVGSTNYTVTVGAGGAGQGNVNGDGDAGQSSVFSTITSTGGGGGASQDSSPGASGGSGGGGAGKGSPSGVVTDPGSGTASQGRDGGAGGLGAGGGGGGASAAGGARTDVGGNYIGGAGGAGLASSITGSSVTRAGGGGGSGDNGDGAGGAGGGGAGGSPGVNATANSGGGGGGTRPNNQNGRNGGSGVVILRWLTASGSITVGAGLTADATGTDGSHSYKVFTAGSGNVSFA